MHRSRLGGLIIDCRADDLGAAARFWAEALGMPRIAEPKDEPAPDRYAHLENRTSHHDVEVQLVRHESRVHLDIETDDVPAEVARLERLGAKRVSALEDWVVMEAPTGHRFCVVPANTDGFAAGANVWDGNAGA
jgi:hypothetical protein